MNFWLILLKRARKGQEPTITANLFTKVKAAAQLIRRLSGIALG
jgi:hypothetical protein